MGDVAQKPGLMAQIATLRQEQIESVERATFVGWSPKALTDHQRRSVVLRELFAQLKACKGCDSASAHFPHD